MLRHQIHAPLTVVRLLVGIFFFFFFFFRSIPPLHHTRAVTETETERETGRQTKIKQEKVEESVQVSEARRQGFSPGTPVSSPPSSV